MIKATVVVPTYRSTEHLDELVASLDCQTLPQDEFEVLLVDDGSPDDTFPRLQRIAARRANYRVFRLSPSGWPSAPRNHGIDQARGEYLVFLDHDDRLFPDALRAAYELASRTRADVLDGKESKSDSPGWWLRDSDDDVDNAIDWTERHPLLPMNPHKMFRTAFVRDKGIRFPEGGRQIWEDIHFDIAAHARAEVVSILASTPFYFWNRPEDSTTSATFHDDLGEYLDAVGRVFQWIDEELQQERFDELRPRFQAYQLHMRVLPLFAREGRSPEEQEQIRAFVSALLPRVPEAADTHLDPWRRIKAALLRAGRFDLVERHEHTAARLVCVPTARAVRWEAGALRADLAIEWELQAESGSAVVRQGDRVRLALDPEVAAFAAERGLSDDATDALGKAVYAIDRRSRREKVDWMLSPAAAPGLAESGVAPLLQAAVPLRWEPADDGPGRLHDGPWDFYVRTTVLRTRVVRQVRTDFAPPRWAVVAGRLMAAYRTQGGRLAVDVGQTAVSVLDAGEPVVTMMTTGRRARFAVELPHVDVHSALSAPGDLVGADGESVGSCRVTVVDGAARLVGEVGGSVGAFSVVFGGRPARTRLVAVRGRVRVLGGPGHGLARRAWETLPDGMRRRVWRWRHRR
ncbi:MAG: glycosyltransferase family 2 protein [Microbacterium sp.]|uniref:glycosyltransferase n=1 Tax=Microbacterium sp. TaxID=51671 RepID=UPI0039E28929